MDPEVMELVNKYINDHIDFIADRTYRTLVQIDNNVSLDGVRSLIKHHFDRLYSMAEAVDKAFGKERCEAERANAALKSIQEGAVFLCIRDLKMTLQ